MTEITIAIPTYNRGPILLQTIERLLSLDPPASEVLIMDQTDAHDERVTSRLDLWARNGFIRWIRLVQPSIPHAMNRALCLARTPIVLFMDDDVVPPRRLVTQHADSYETGIWAVVGQILQPGQLADHIDEKALHRGPVRDLEFPFNHDTACEVENVMAGNLSVQRAQALSIGGFDENFVGAAYRFETDFARRLITAGGRIRFEPAASMQHLKIATGGLRALGDHRRTASPLHSVGDYYFALWHAPSFWRYAARRLSKNVFTRFHFRHPWTIPSKIMGEVRGIALALQLKRSGRKLSGSAHDHVPLKPER